MEILDSNIIPFRIHFPDDEPRMAWLPDLLDACAIIDASVNNGIERERAQGREVACHMGCAVCCSQTDIPLFPHELVGIYWYVAEKLELKSLHVIKRRLSRRRTGGACLFLMDGSCSIHPIRPAACREFNVFGGACLPGEDPFHQRPRDVLEVDHGALDRALMRVLAFYRTEPKKRSIPTLQEVRSKMMNLQTYDWSKLLQIIKR